MLTQSQRRKHEFTMKEKETRETLLLYKNDQNRSMGLTCKSSNNGKVGAPNTPERTKDCTRTNIKITTQDKSKEVNHIQ